MLVTPFVALAALLTTTLHSCVGLRHVSGSLAGLPS